MRRKRSEAPDGLSQGLIKNGQNLSFSSYRTASDLEAPADSADSPCSGVAQITSPADPEGERRQKNIPFQLYLAKLQTFAEVFEENRYG